MKKIITITGLFLAPVIVSAQGSSLQGLLFRAGDIVNLLISVAGALALLFFFWGLAKFILKAGDESAREEGKHVMVWGIVALFVIASIWGITAFIGGELGIVVGPIF